LLSVLVFTYAAYSTMVTTVNTAAGNDEVVWPREPLQDNIGLLFYMAWIIAIWMVPAHFLLKLTDLPAEWRAGIMIFCLWLVFPFSFLSSLSGSSRLIIIRLAIARSFAAQAPTIAAFYGTSLVLAVLCLGTVRLGVTASLLWVFPAGFVSAWGLLVYARLVGRVGWSLSQTRLKRRRKPGAPPEAEDIEIFDPWAVSEDEDEDSGDEPTPAAEELPPEKRKKLLHERVEAADPWAVRDEEPAPLLPKPVLNEAGEEDPLGPSTGSYQVAAESTAVPAPAGNGAVLPNPEIETYALAPHVETPPPVIPPPPLEQTKIEKELAAPREPPPPPRWLLASGVYSFPFYPRSLMAFFILGMGFMGITTLLHLMWENWPAFLNGN
jgi:hypothetical protein